MIDLHSSIDDAMDLLQEGFIVPVDPVVQLIMLGISIIALLCITLGVGAIIASYSETSE